MRGRILMAIAKTTAEVVIIGGGIAGASIAWHLTSAGCKNVLIIERETAQGKGSTGKSMGGVRAQFSTPVNIQMSLYSIPFYARFDEVLGHPAGYRPQGYMFLATKQAHLAYLRANCEAAAGGRRSRGRRSGRRWAGRGVSGRRSWRAGSRGAPVWWPGTCSPGGGIRRDGRALRRTAHRRESNTATSEY